MPSVLTITDNLPETEMFNGHPLIKVRPNSGVPGIGTQIFLAIKDHDMVIVRAIGAGAVNQAVKGIVNARQRLFSQNEDMVARPGIMVLKGNDGGDVTAVTFNCFLG